MQSVPRGYRSSAPTGADRQHSRGAEAYARVRQMLLDHEIEAGSTVTEAELTRILAVSRTPVREALTRLAGEGFLRASSGRGYVVTELTAQDLVDVYAVRIELEGLATGEAAERVKRVDLARLEDLFDEMSEAKLAGDDRFFAGLNNKFHAMIAEISGNAFLKSTLDDIRAIFDVYSSTALTEPGRREQTHEEHGAIIEAMREHDGVKARALVRTHFEHSLAIRQVQLARRSKPAAEAD